MTIITINSTPPAVVDIIQQIPPRVTVVGTPGEPGPPGPPGSDGAPTRVVILPIPGGYGPQVHSALQELVTSSGGPTANAPFVTYYQNAYDPTTDQEWFWSFMLPGDYGSGGTLRLIWASKGTNVSPVVWKAATAIGVIGTTDSDAAVFDTVVTASDVPNAVRGIMTQTMLPLTMANAVANSPIIVMIGRDADNGLDTNPNPAILLEATFEYERT